MATIAASCLIMRFVISPGGANSSVAGMLMLCLVYTGYQFVLSNVISVTADDFALLSHTGKGALWLEIFLCMLSVMSLALCAVLGNNPRQHWRRYAVAAVLVSIMSVSVFVANEMSLRYSNAHFELSRLTETLNGQRSSLHSKSMQFYEKSDADTLSMKVPSDVFAGMQIYFDTSIQIEELMQDRVVEKAIREAYNSSTFENDFTSEYTLKEDIDAFYSHLKSTFGLQSAQFELSENQQIALERRLNAFSNLILSKARKASNTQIMIKEMVLIGGVFIITFLIFGVFLPAHKSTIQALDALEAEKARIYKLALCAEHTTKGICPYKWTRSDHLV